MAEGTTFDRLKKLIVEQLGVDEEESASGNDWSDMSHFHDFSLIECRFIGQRQHEKRWGRLISPQHPIADQLRHARIVLLTQPE